MHRLGIFLFYDSKGRVSPHVHTSIKAFSQHVDNLIFVVNGSLDMQTYAGLEEHVTHLLKRENVGFDVWGYKAGIEYIGYDALGEYDEIVLLNYTFFAPTMDLGTMFAQMDAREDLDGWGMTEYSDSGKTFLQSYFLCSRKSLHASYDYRNYWQTMPMIKSINDSLDYHEFRFSRYFRELGYTFEPYVKNRENWNGNTTLTDVGGLLDAGMPIIKYRSFNFDPEIVEARGGRKVAENFAIVRDKTVFPMSQIWDYIIDQTGPDELIAAAELCEVVDTTAPIAPLQGLQVVATLSDFTTLDLALERLDRVPTERVLIATNNDEIRAAVTARNYQTQDTDVLHFALRSACKTIEAAERDGLAVVHLSDFIEEHERYFFKEILFRNYWDSLLNEDAIRWLEQSDHLGMVYAFPDAVAGITSYRTGTGTSLGNWKKGFRPDYLRRAANQEYWPWRGNILIKANLAADPHFQKQFSKLLDNVLQRDRESLAGPEGALPEMIRDLGFACGIVVPRAETGKLLLRAASRSKASIRKNSELAQKFRRDLQRTQEGGNVTAKSAHVENKKTARVENKEHANSEAPTLTRHGSVGKQYYTLVTSTNQERFEDALQLRYSFETWDTLGGGLFATGWAFDMRSPHNFIHIGILDGKGFIYGPEELGENRPDVLEAFRDMPPVERSGFDFSLPRIEMDFAERYQIVFMNFATHTLCIMPFRAGCDLSDSGFP